jgi:hypothetical protein
MPLRDHFHPPLSVYRHWESLHSKWSGSIVDQLNEQLPPRYFAEPHVHRGSTVEIDVGTFEGRSDVAEQGGVATAVWSPPRPTLTAPLPAAAFESFEVRIINDEAGPRLVAAIELVSPGNKDRPLARRAFAIKCAAYLQQGVSVMVVDIVTSRTANLHRELADLLSLAPDVSGTTTALHAAAYRTLIAAEEGRLETWLEPLALGARLPTLPLWLNAYDCVGVDLEQSYEAACQTLRIE